MISLWLNLSQNDEEDVGVPNKGLIEAYKDSFHNAETKRDQSSMHYLHSSIFDASR